MRKLFSREELIKYMLKNNLSTTKEFAGEIIDNGVENINWMNIKYLGYDKFEIN
jgi:hypothetical protein